MQRNSMFEQRSTMRDSLNNELKLGYQSLFEEKQVELDQKKEQALIAYQQRQESLQIRDKERI